MNIKQRISLIFIISAASIVATFWTTSSIILKSTFDISTEKLSTSITLYLLGYLVGQIIFASISKFKGGIFSIRSGMIIALLGYILEYFSVQNLSFNLFNIGRLLNGLGLSAGLVCGFTIIKDNILKSNLEKKYLSLVAISFTASIYISVLISSFLIKNFNILAIINFLLFHLFLLLCLTFFLPDSKVQQRASIKKYKLNFVNFKVISYGFILSITTIISYCYAFYGPLIFEVNFNYNVQMFGYFNLLNMCGLFLGSYSYNKINKKYNENQILIFCLSLIITLTASLVLSYYFNVLNFTQFILIFFFIEWSSGLIYPSATFQALNTYHCRNSSSATMNMIKIGMPSLAIFFSALIRNNAILSLLLTLICFSFLYLVITLIVQNIVKLKRT